MSYLNLQVLSGILLAVMLLPLCPSVSWSVPLVSLAKVMSKS